MGFSGVRFRVAGFVMLIGAFAPVASAGASCPESLAGRGAVLVRLQEIGGQLALGRLCSVSESALKQFRQHAIQQVSSCLLDYQIKGTEIQDALEQARPQAHLAWKQAADKKRLCATIGESTQ
ncbi:MAG TPA: hypothetical protein VFV64_12305 [Permianibacter sp.]|nr:hypothetical protein [Permianibacter sp.]